LERQKISHVRPSPIGGSWLKEALASSAWIFFFSIEATSFVVALQHRAKSNSLTLPSYLPKEPLSNTYYH